MYKLFKNLKMPQFQLELVQLTSPDFYQLSNLRGLSKGRLRRWWRKKPRPLKWMLVKKTVWLGPANNLNKNQWPQPIHQLQMSKHLPKWLWPEPQCNSQDSGLGPKQYSCSENHKVPSKSKSCCYTRNRKWAYGRRARGSFWNGLQSMHG